MTLLVVKDVAFAPIDIRLFGAVGIVFCPNRIAELVE